MDKVSVVVPAYQAENYIRECVDSILGQTYGALEVILIDDGSKDSTPGILDAYAEADSRVRVIHQENKGLAETRNVGIEAATGRWLTYVDADDRLAADTVEKLVKAAEETGARFVRCGYTEMDPEGKLTEPEKMPVEKLSIYEAREAELDSYEPGRMMGWVVAWNKLYDLSLFKEGEKIRYPKGRIFEDASVTYRLIWKSGRAAVVNEPLYEYRFWQGGLMKAHGGKNYRDAFAVSLEKMEFYRTKGEKELYRREVNYSMYKTIEYYGAAAGREDRKKIKRYFKRFYRDHFKTIKWDAGKRIRMKAFDISYGLYRFVSAFEGVYNRLR